MDKYELVKQAILLIEQFEQETTRPEAQNLVNFAAWLNQTLLGKKIGDPSRATQMMTAHETVDSVLSKMIAYLYRYSRSYSKKMLEQSPLVTADDFTYLALLNARGSMTKTELIDLNIHEKTTGIEIIKRLLKNGLVEQRDDEADKRSKRLTLTARGRGVLFASFPGMGQVATLTAGNLSESEKMQLLYLLNKLHLFHNAIHKESRDASVEAIIT
ncbi:MAG: MarR family transcriptional regulator, partial [Cytophagales bacterium]|nr:MarR family transcriptional regulator [Cytophagales bacterium]